MHDTVAARLRALALIMAIATAPAQLAAQEHRHDPAHMRDAPTAADARLGGQAAFATIAEVIRLLDADTTTDWSKVDLERLRAHLVEMDAVTMRAVVAREDVRGGARFTVRGDTATVAAAGRMIRAHAPFLRRQQGYEATIAAAPGALRVTVTAGRLDDAAAAARIRALGFVGLLATGEHHAAHHVAMARGDAAAHTHE